MLSLFVRNHRYLGGGEIKNIKWLFLGRNEPPIEPPTHSRSARQSKNLLWWVVPSHSMAGWITLWFTESFDIGNKDPVLLCSTQTAWWHVKVMSNVMQGVFVVVFVSVYFCLCVRMWDALCVARLIVEDWTVCILGYQSALNKIYSKLEW